MKAAGIHPGLGTVLVGDDPGSHSYVAGKHRDCHEVGIESVRVDLAATATQAEVMASLKELNANPTCTGYIVQLPLPKGLDADAALEAIDPAKTASVAARVTGRVSAVAGGMGSLGRCVSVRPRR